MSYWNLESAGSGQVKRINEVFMRNCSRWKWCHQKYSSFLFYFFSLLNVCMGIINIYKYPRHVSVCELSWKLLILGSRSTCPIIWISVHIGFRVRERKFQGEKKVNFLSPTDFPFSVWKSLIQAWKYLFTPIMLLERPQFFICYWTRACQWGYLDHNVKMPWCPPESCCRK